MYRTNLLEKYSIEFYATVKVRKVFMTYTILEQVLVYKIKGQSQILCNSENKKSVHDVYNIGTSFSLQDKGQSQQPYVKETVFITNCFSVVR